MKHSKSYFGLLLFLLSLGTFLSASASVCCEGERALDTLIGSTHFFAIPEVRVGAQRGGEELQEVGFFEGEVLYRLILNMSGVLRAVYIANPLGESRGIEILRIRLFAPRMTTVGMGIRFFAVDSVTGSPGRELLDPPIALAPSDFRDGLEVDLSGTGLRFPEEGFFVAIYSLPANNPYAVQDVPAHIPLMRKRQKKGGGSQGLKSFSRRPGEDWMPGETKYGVLPISLLLSPGR